MSLAACAELVARGDPDRFRVAMAAPPAAREVLLPLYAFNLEVARAPWRTREPLLAEMRLQWWRDVLERTADGGTPPAHEVAGPLGVLLGSGRIDPAPLDALIEARRRDIEASPLASVEVRPYLSGTAGNLLWASARALGGTDREAAMKAGFAGGLAAFLVALPDLAASGRGLADTSDAAIRALAGEALDALAEARRSRPGPAVPAYRAASHAAATLRAALRDPSAARDGRLGPSEAGKRARLLWLTLRGEW